MRPKSGHLAVEMHEPAYMTALKGHTRSHTMAPQHAKLENTIEICTWL